MSSTPIRYWLRGWSLWGFASARVLVHCCTGAGNRQGANRKALAIITWKGLRVGGAKRPWRPVCAANSPQFTWTGETERDA